MKLKSMGHVSLQKDKTCKDCKESFPRSTEYFYVHKWNTDSLTTCCKACHLLRGKRSYTKNAKRLPEQKYKTRSDADFHNWNETALYVI